MSLNLRRDRNDEGAVAVVVALTSLLLIGIGALAVDIGSLYSVRRESQRTADLAVLAGAQSLPGNPTLACQEALAYLDRNKPGYDASNPTIPNPTGYGISPATCGTTGTSDGKTVKISADGLTMDVKVPDQAVSLGLAGVFGYSKGYTAAGATVEIRSPGRVLPFGLTLCKKTGFVTVKTDSKTTADCTDASSGDFGFLDIPRAGVTGNADRLEANVNYGIDHSIVQLKPWPTTPPPGPILPNTECKDITASGVTVPKIDYINDPPVEGANCVDIDNGNKTSSLRKALLESQNNACDGRLTRVRPGAATLIFAGCTVDNDTFLTFLLGGATVSQAAAGTLPSGAISQDILKSPNFFVVPLLNADKHPPNGYYPIVDFLGFYLECFSDGSLVGACPQTTSGQIQQLQGYAFSLDALPAVTADDGDTSIYYGGGTRVPVLVK